jgi:MoaA/NifB/PqqE/SkfB family radical SAM enzyme
MLHCPYTYKGVVLLPKVGDHYEITPCCRYGGGILLESDNLNYEYKHGEMDKLRKRLDAGERVEECAGCWIDEDNSITSMRQHGLNIWGTVSEPSIEFLECELDNTCNLKCNMCSSGRSTAWIKDEIKIFGKSAFKAFSTDLYKKVDFSTIKTIKLIGGEPLLSNNIEDLCTQITQLGNLKNQNVEITTNGTIIPTGVVEEVLLNCKSLKLTISIDGIEELYEFIRLGSSWKTILNNLNYFEGLFNRRKSDTVIMIHCVATLYNVNYLDKLDNFFKIHFPKFIRTTEVLSSPDFLSLRALPDNYKKFVKTYLLKHNYTDIIPYIDEQHTDLFNYFISYHKKLMTLTDIDFNIVNPELAKYINNYNCEPANEQILFFKRHGQI